MTRFRSALLLLLATLAGCASPKPIPLEVEYAGCRAVLVPGPVCVLDSSRKLQIWVGAPPDAGIEIQADGTFVSRSSGREFYRTLLAPRLTDTGEVSFHKPDGQTVTLRFLDRETLLALQDGKPPAKFQRR